jgi:hypothetical protein
MGGFLKSIMIVRQNRPEIEKVTGSCWGNAGLLNLTRLMTQKN